MVAVVPSASVALNRFGLGARPDQPPPADPKAWLLAQFDKYDPKPDAIANAPSSAAIAGAAMMGEGTAAPAVGAAATIAAVWPPIICACCRSACCWRK